MSIMLASGIPYRRLDSPVEALGSTFAPEPAHSETGQRTTDLSEEALMIQRPEGVGCPMTLFGIGHGHELLDRFAGLTAPDRLEIETFAAAEDFLSRRAQQACTPGCLVLDVHLPGMSGLELQQALHDRSDRIPLIFVTTAAEVPTVVQAMQSGALDFIVAPLDEPHLQRQIRTALDSSCRQYAREMQQQAARRRIAKLSKREEQVFRLLAQGQNTKEIANRLGIAHPTVSKHRGNVFAKLEISNLMELALLAQRAL
jgi:FixJ family two-component response regulator